MKMPYRSTEPRWFMTCKKCSHRYHWTGKQSDNPGCPECARAKATKLQGPPGRIRLQAVPAENSVGEALDLADEAISLIDELPEAAYDFGVSVGEKLADIRESIAERNHVTDKQRSAIENMLAGIQRWLRY